MVNCENIVNGLTRYIDCEVIPKLPTAGKWVVGSAAVLFVRNAESVIRNLQSSGTMKIMGISDNGMIDEDAVLDAMKESAAKYGNLVVTFPIVGTMKFTDADVELMRRYIKG